MRLAGTAAIGLALLAALPACAPRDPVEAAPRVAAGAVLGATMGAAIGATFALTPPVGAAMGAATGGVLGAAIGLATSPPAPSYAPIAVPAEPVIPSYYDNWPPGWHRPPSAPGAPPARAG